MTQTRYQRIEPFLIGIGIPVALALLGLLLPIAYSMSPGLVVVKFSQSKFEEQYGSAQKSSSEAFARLEAGIANIGQEIKSIDSRMARQEVDASSLVAAAGLDIGPAVKVRFIKDGIWAFPTSAEEEAKFTKAGMTKENITPVVSGYKIPVTPEFEKAIDTFITEATSGSSKAVATPDAGAVFESVTPQQ